MAILYANIVSYTNEEFPSGIFVTAVFEPRRI